MSDWIEWKGGKCPVEPETVVKVRTRSGHQLQAAPAEVLRWDWPHGGLPAEIVSYRVVEAEAPWVSGKSVRFAVGPAIPIPPEKPFSTRITEAEEKAEAAMAALEDAIGQLVGPDYDGLEDDPPSLGSLARSWGEIRNARETIATAAALARDYARKEG